mmetsp:Transcript_59211/g.72413  ORF Transcript_59211/g.72413 Transcript_59211/m.72413 type:complete len:123 (+) Transcript_59211:281-649(+)
MAYMDIPLQSKKSIKTLGSIIGNKNGSNIEHPLSKINNKMLDNKQKERKEMLTNMFGVHAGFRMEMDEFVLKTAKPGLPNKIPFGLEILLNRDETIDNFDYLNSDDPMQETFDLQKLEDIFG